MTPEDRSRQPRVTWRRLAQQGCIPGDVPCARGGHSLVAIGGRLLLFGGYDGRRYFDDLHILADEYWRRFNTKGPSARHGHACGAVGGSMVLFGGRRGSSFLGDTFIFNGTWRQYRGPAPRARCFAACVETPRSVVLFGGRDAVRSYNDLWVFDSKWTLPMLVGAPPAPRFGHVMLNLGDDGFLVCGGRFFARERDDEPHDTHDVLVSRRNETEARNSAFDTWQDAARIAANVARAEAATVRAVSALRNTSKRVQQPLTAGILLNGAWWPSSIKHDAVHAGAAGPIVLGNELLVYNDKGWKRPFFRGLSLFTDSRQLARDTARSLGVARAEENLRVISTDVKRPTRPISPDAPQPRTLCAAAAVGKRVFVHGGFNGVSFLADLLVVSLESEFEEHERLQEELRARLELERRLREVDDADVAATAAHRAMLDLDRLAASRAFEVCVMRFEDIRACVPPLTRAPKVELEKVNARCMWLRWQAVTRDALGKPCKPTHLLFMLHGDSWSLVHCGQEATCVVEGLVSELDLGTFTVERTFRLHTRGTEYGWDGTNVIPTDDFSLPSPLAVFATVNSSSRRRECNSSSSVFHAQGQGDHYI